jgi:hypothetical protein
MRKIARQAGLLQKLPYEISGLTAVVSLPVMQWLVFHAILYSFMLADGLYTVDELYSREVGIFLVLNLVVPPLTILGAIVVWTVVWWKTGKKRIASEQNA